MSKKKIKKVLVNPAIIAVYIGIPIMLLNIKLPSFLIDTTKIVGDMTAPISMIIVGSILSKVRIKDVFKEVSIYYEALIKLIIIPLILISFVLDFTNNISNEFKIGNLCKLTKQITIWIQGIILTIFIGLLTVRGITSSTIDAVTLKTAKFAIDNFIPIVGKAFSDAIASVAGYSLIIKNAVSSIGLIIIVIMMLYPIIKLLLITFVYKLTAAIIEPISDKRITSSIASAGDSLILLMSCVLSVSLMFFVLISIMISAGKFVVGG